MMATTTSSSINVNAGLLLPSPLLLPAGTINCVFKAE
jgi:hypothetical protein